MAVVNLNLSWDGRNSWKSDNINLAFFSTQEFTLELFRLKMYKKINFKFNFFYLTNW